MANIRINDVIVENQNFIAAGNLQDMADVAYTVTDPYLLTSLNSTGNLTSSGTYTGTENAIYHIRVVSDADKSDGDLEFQWRKSFDGGETWLWLAADGTTWNDPATADDDFDWSVLPTYSGTDPVTIDEGVEIQFELGEYKEGETYIIEASAGGVLSESSNENAIAISGLLETTQETYHQLLSTIGIKSLTVSREKDLLEVATEQLQELRENVSGVSLDDEFTKLVQFQRSYQASAKIITTCDELLQTAIGLKA